MMTIIGLSFIILSPVGLGISKMTRNNTRLRIRASVVLWIKRGQSKMGDVIDISFLSLNKPVAYCPNQSLMSGMEEFAKGWFSSSVTDLLDDINVEVHGYVTTCFPFFSRKNSHLTGKHSTGRTAQITDLSIYFVQELLNDRIIFDNVKNIINVTASHCS